MIDEDDLAATSPPPGPPAPPDDEGGGATRPAWRRRRVVLVVLGVLACIAVGAAAIVAVRSAATDEAPDVAAGADLLVGLDDEVALAGVVTGGGDDLVVGWTQVEGPAPATFADAANPTTTVTFSEVGTYVLALTADDGSDEPARDEVTVRVAEVVVRADFDQPGIDLGQWTLDEHNLAYPSTRGAAHGVPDRTSLVEVDGFGRMIEAAIPKDAVGTVDTGMSFKSNLPVPDQDELWIEQTFMLREDWPWSKGPDQLGGKLGPGFYWGPSLNGGCRPSDGGRAEARLGSPQPGSGGSVRISWHTMEGAASFYLYHADMGGDPDEPGSECGIKFGWVRDDEGNVIAATPANPFPSGNNYVHPVGELTTYVIHVKMNTPGKRDGEVDAYANGVHVGAVRKIRFRVPGIDWGIRTAAQNVYLGGHSEGHEFATDTSYFAGPQTVYASPPVDETEAELPPKDDPGQDVEDTGDDDSGDDEGG